MHTAFADESILVSTIVAGKLRRYAHLTFLQHFTVPSVVWGNLRDSVLVMIGVVQSIVRLLLWRPDVVFAKGGYVCLPVGWAASLLRIPLVIHDSDAHPGLTNRLLARHARTIATGAPLEHYRYPKHKSHYVGIPVAPEFHPYTLAEQRAAKESIGVAVDRPLVVITGGGLGARRINDAVARHARELMALATVVLVSGATQYSELRARTPQGDDRFVLLDFVSGNMATYLGAADVVVARAGATTILELAAMAKPTVLIPNARLTGDHQSKNAAVYAKEHAVVLLNEDAFDAADDTSLVTTLEALLESKDRRTELATALYGFAKPHAARDMARLIGAAVQK